jgi:2-keto-3-deoxy-L-fuconate dehydrogenase
VFSLENKTVLVTGSGSGIGQAIALRFAQQGAKVAVADLQPAAAQETVSQINATAKNEAIALTLDVAEEAQVKAAIDHIAQHWGRLDILVNNAGISHVGNILETSLEDWEKVMRVNSGGVFLCAKYALQQMLAQSPAGGNIINIASVAGLIAVERRLPYCASKGAVVALTRSIAIDFANQNIRCNAICPGTVYTPFVEGYLERNYADQKAEMLAQLHARQPIGRMGNPDEIAHAALYLASEEAAFVTGSMLTIDGGWTAK